MSLRSPLGKALGHGSAKSGFHHWWAQRLTAAALVPLGLWFAASLLGMGSFDYWAVSAWVGEPLHAILLLLLLGTVLYHSSLGVQVVIEDYVHHPGGKVAALVFVRFAHVAMGVAGLYSVVTLSVGGQA